MIGRSKSADFGPNSSMMLPSRSIRNSEFLILPIPVYLMVIQSYLRLIHHPRFLKLLSPVKWSLTSPILVFE